MDNPETLTTYGTRNRTLSILVYIKLLYRNGIEIRRVIKNGQSRDTDNIRHQTQTAKHTSIHYVVI
jgi:hypothetical protein